MGHIIEYIKKCGYLNIQDEANVPTTMAANLLDMNSKNNYGIMEYMMYQ